MRDFLRGGIIFLLAGFISCSDKKTDYQDETAKIEKPVFTELAPEFASYHVIMTGYDTSEFHKHYEIRIDPPQIDLNQPLNNKSLSELIILKNTLLARERRTA